MRARDLPATSRGTVRDPLRNVSVRYKLAFAFLGVCLLAFGVGGYLVSRSAREALGHEILAHLRLRSRYHATLLEGDLRSLGRRSRDFASDGYIRTRFGDLVGAARPEDVAAVEAALRAHLVENKLPLEPAFANLALVDATGEHVLIANDRDVAWTDASRARARTEGDWFSGLCASERTGSAPYVVLGTPIRSLDGGEHLGSLLVKVHAGVWLAGALAGGLAVDGPHEGELELRLIDGERRTLVVPPAFLTEPPPPLDGVTVQQGVGLRVREHDASAAAVTTHGRGVLARREPLALDGWWLETSLETDEAFRAIAGLQTRFLLVGLVLTGAAAVILLFPMRFIAAPIRRLHEAAMDLRGGDFGVRVPVESNDEIGELSRSFNLMAEAIEERAERLEASARSLEQNRDDLRRERDRLNAVILSMRDGLMVLDADGRPEVWNSAAEPLRAVVESGGVELSAHRNCQVASAVSAATAAFAAPDGVGVLDDGGDERHACLRCLFDSGAPPRSCLLDAGPFVYEVHSTRLAPDRDGRAGRVLVARDVTDRVHEDEREIHQERLSVLGEVAAVMAHELNNPLASINMFTQMIASKLPEGSPLHEDVAVIDRNTATCTRTIRDLLDYATGATPEVGPVDVHESLREVARFLRAFRERGESELELVLSAEDAVVVGDEVQLRQVFVNLVLNAFQAAGDGRVSVRTSLDGGHLAIDVRDDGPGIPPERAEAIFRPFFTTKPRGSGTGLGLSTARRITEIQGGSLELLDGRPGRTTFRVRLLRRDA